MGPCTLPPLALAVEEPGYYFHIVVSVLVDAAGIDPSAPYEIVSPGRRVRTTPLTHLLARWNRNKTESCRNQVLNNLIAAGADAAAPALFEPSGSELTPYERALADASGQSLMAFALGQRLQCRVPFYFVEDMVERGGARFRPADPPALFASWVHRTADEYDWSLARVVDFLCPLAESHAYRRIAGGMLRPGEVARGELRRVVQGLDPVSGLNLLHMYVVGGGECDLPRTVERLRLLRDVYGLSLLARTRDGASATALATRPRMREAVALVLDEELLPRRRALVVAQRLRMLPHLPLAMIGSHAELPLLGAREVDERLSHRRK